MMADARRWLDSQDAAGDPAREARQQRIARQGVAWKDWTININYAAPQPTSNEAGGGQAVGGPRLPERRATAAGGGQSSSSSDPEGNAVETEIRAQEAERGEFGAGPE